MRGAVVGRDPWSVARAAEALELHPFEVVRLLAIGPGLPTDLQLRREHVARVVELGGLEAWWEEGRPPTPADLRPLARALLARKVIEPRWTRADNLFRGLDAEGQIGVRRAVNGWIRSGAMGSRWTGRGLEVAVRADAVEAFERFAVSGVGELLPSQEGR